MARDSEKLNRLEDLKTKLYSKNYEMKIRSDMKFHHDSLEHKVSDTWDKEDKKFLLPEKIFMQTSIFKKFFIFSIIFFVLASVFAFYNFVGKGNTISNENIEISVLGNAFTGGGEELPLQIEIINRNTSALELADLLVEYPRSASSDLNKDTEKLRVSLGSIPSGGVKNENIKVVLFGEQGSIKPIKFLLEYRVAGSNAIFVKEKPYEVSISSTPVNILVEGPKEISPNQDISLRIKAQLNATRSVQRMIIKIDYPVGFQFQSARPSPVIGNNIWNLGDLPPGGEKEITLTGKMVDVYDGEEKNFKVWSGSENLVDKTEIGTVFNSLSHTVFVKKPFIAANLFINGVYQNEYAVDTKSKLQGEIKWVNNMDTKISDMQIRAKLSGNALDESKIEVKDGFYNSAQDTIVWDKNSLKEFADIPPGKSGYVSFSLSPLALLGGTNGILSDPSINIEVSIAGRQASDGYAINELKNSESKNIRIITEAGFVSKILYYSGAFKNSGPIPPRVEQKTTYTVVWSLSNTANNISRAQVKTSLPPWASFVGPVSPPSEDLSYNPSTKEIVWNIGTLMRGIGVTGSSREVSFQIELLPSLSQLGTPPTLINDTIFTGQDDFANVGVRINKSSLNTRLSNDPSFPPTGDRVIQ
ncbi:MAG: hypothetical protein K9L98_01360 [Candidatus Pacebacteria bacterium]|nr:hypothetical protein [Candidatus Paceibacterota bacterium]MCF7862640.1 hypothetical protein [Candidatus Paceibacterota bacterium]